METEYKATKRFIGSNSFIEKTWNFKMSKKRRKMEAELAERIPPMNWKEIILTTIHYFLQAFIEALEKIRRNMKHKMRHERIYDTYKNLYEERGRKIDGLIFNYDNLLRAHNKLKKKYQILLEIKRKNERISKPVNINKFLHHVKQHVELNNSEKEQSTQDYLRDINDDEKLK